MVCHRDGMMITMIKTLTLRCGMDPGQGHDIWFGFKDYATQCWYAVADLWRGGKQATSYHSYTCAQHHHVSTPKHSRRRIKSIL